MEWETLMSTRPRYHDLGAWDHVRGKEIRQAARVITRIFNAQNRHDEWRDRSCWRPPRWREPWRSRPRWSRGQNPRTAPPRPRGPWHRRPPRDAVERSRMAFQQDPRSSRPCNWRFLVFPRRGPPAAAIKVPRGYCPEDLTTRQPRGVKPRGPLRGGPERLADDPRRNLEVVCVEAPQGQPRNHGHQARSHGRTPPEARRQKETRRP